MRNILDYFSNFRVLFISPRDILGYQGTGFSLSVLQEGIIWTIPYVAVGAFALNALGGARGTLDVDFMIMANYPLQVDTHNIPETGQSVIIEVPLVGVLM